MKFSIIVILIAVLFTACDTILQGDRDFSPTLTLIKQSQTEEDLIFTFEMYGVENMTSFACEIIFELELFEPNIEYFDDENNNGSYDFGEEFIDCGIDNLCDEDEPGYDENSNPDPNGDNFDMEDNPYGPEGNGSWNDYTVMYAGYFGALSNFFPVSNSESGKVSLAAGLVNIADGIPMMFSVVDGVICTITLKINPEIENDRTTILTIDSWKLIKENGADIYFGYQVVTDTLYVDFAE